MPAEVETQEDDARRRRLVWWWALPVAVLVMLGLLVDGLVDELRPRGTSGGSGSAAQAPGGATPAPSPAPASVPQALGSGSTSTLAGGAGSSISGGSTSAAVGKPAPAVTPAAAQPLPKQLTVTAGSVAGLVLTDASVVPTTTVPLTVTNPNNQVVLVTSVTPRVTGVQRADGTPATGCPLSTLRITPFTGALQVAKGASSLLPLPVQLVNDPAVNQDDCKRAVFTVVYDLGARSLV